MILQIVLASILAVVRIPGPGGSTPVGSSGWDATPIDHTSVSGAGAGGTVTTSALACTGATHYFVILSEFGIGADLKTISYNDGSSHNFTNVTTGAFDSSPSSIAIFWAEITGAASVTFSGTTDFGSLYASCWKSGAASSSFDQQSASGAVNCYATCAISLTPTVDNSLIILGGSSFSGTTGLAASGFTCADPIDFTGGTSVGGEWCYKVVSGGSGVAQNVSITNTGGNGTVQMANFKPL